MNYVMCINNEFLVLDKNMNVIYKFNNFQDAQQFAWALNYQISFLNNTKPIGNLPIKENDIISNPPAVSYGNITINVPYQNPTPIELESTKTSESYSKNKSGTFFNNNINLPNKETHSNKKEKNKIRNKTKTKTKNFKNRKKPYKNNEIKVKKEIEKTMEIERTDVISEKDLANFLKKLEE
ncbi:hypothetical protein [Spiroplasma sp. BIUS-1]|uniref:hypothetical protein n=1 Tax=Spiroplasma sp. BIUS-1 TaxID=216964 RepID=UPI0013981599|nr:hypothetical protein [Spiroplasma sp. BIUS-1]QHX36794.1 hypothetical protein SBIUS_v1c05410 [Spiroplasma sp. BIUS-1]